MARRGRGGVEKWKGLQEEAPSEGEPPEAGSSGQGEVQAPAPAPQPADSRRFALVTGATGRLGGKLVQALLGKGFRVRALVRAQATLPAGAEQFIGNLSDKASLLDAMDGVDTVFHLAALVRHSASPEELLETNFYGTRNLIEACKASTPKFRRLVYASSISVYGKVITNLPATEATPLNPSDWYGKSKMLAEDSVLQCAKQFQIVILRPAIVYGEGFDEAYLPLLSALEKGRMPVIGSGSNVIPFIHEKDVVRAFVLAADSEEAPGNVYVIAPSERKTQREAMALACGLLGVGPPKLSIPPFLASLALKAAGFALGQDGGKGMLLEEHIATLTADRYFDASKAERDLGFKAEIPLERGMKEMVEYYKSAKAKTQGKG